MCYFTSQHLRAEDVARKYGRRMDAVNAARVVLTQKEEEARQKAAVTGMPDKTTIYDYRLNDGMYVSPAYSEPYTVIVTDSDQLQVMRWGLIPYTASEASKERFDRQNLYKNAQAEHLFTTWPWRTLWSKKRCVVPVTGFFESHYGPDGKSWPYYILPDDQVAGWLDPRGVQSADVRRFLVTPDDAEFEAWPVRKKFNYGDPYDPSIIDRVQPGTEPA